MADATNRERARGYLVSRRIGTGGNGTPWDEDVEPLTALLDAAEQRVVGEIVAWLQEDMKNWPPFDSARSVYRTIIGEIVKRWGGNCG